MKLSARLGRMPKIDGIKEELGWLKVIFKVMFSVSVVIDMSLIGWIAQNFNSANHVVVVFAILGVSVITGFVVWVNHLAYRRIRELEGL